MAATGADPKKIGQLGKKLGSLQLPCSKDSQLKLLKQLTALLPTVDQSATEETRVALLPCKEALVRTELLHHKDKEVKLFVALCISEVLRIEAPDLPYDDDVLKDLFELIVSSFKGLSETESPLYSKRVHILDTVGAIKLCLLMLDLDNTDELVFEMFKILFNEARDDHPANIPSAMLTIMNLLIKEIDKCPKPLLVEIISNLVKGKKSNAANRLASEVLRQSSAILEPNVIGLLKTIHEKTADSWLQQHYYEILYEIHCSAPRIFLAYAPTIVEGLVNGDETIRVKTVELLGRVFSSPGQVLDKQLVSELIKRMTDKSLDVRLATMQAARDCFDALDADSSEIIEKVSDRLQDPNDQGRMKAVSVLCDIAKANLKAVPLKVLQSVADRLRDTKAGIRTLTMQKLTSVYATHCSASDELEWIPAKIINCGSCKEFRYHTIELALSEELFPFDLPVSDRTRHWIAMIDTADLKCLERILSAKQRFQQEMKEYFLLRQNTKEEENTTEIEKKIKSIGSLLSEKEGSFSKLHQMKDSSIFKKLQTLLDPSTSFSASRSICDDLLSTVGVKHPQHELLRLVAVRCSYLLFGREHILSLLDEFATLKGSEDNGAVSSCMTLLMVFSRNFPEIMEGAEEKIFNLLKDSENDTVKDAVLQVLANSGHCLRDKIGDSKSSIDLTLETLSLEGTRKQAKFAVSAITALASDAGLKALSVLYGHLMKALESRAHLPTVLQSLGCIAQVAMPVFETRESEVADYVLKDLFPKERAEETSKSDWDSRTEECLLKIYGMKALIKSYLPNKDAHLRQSSLKTFQPVLLKLLRFGSINEESKSSEIDKAHIRLAAAKAYLRLSRIWDKEISAATFRCIVMTAQDPVYEVRQGFLLKIHQYLKLQRLPHRYAVAYSLCSVDAKKDIIAEADRHMVEHIESLRREVARLKNNEGLNVCPEFLLAFLVHVLAHHPQFPDLSSSEAAAYEPFYRQLYSYIHALLVQETDVKKEETCLAAILEIFRRIKNTEDTSDSAKNQNLYALCDIGIQIAKDVSKRSPEPFKGPVRLPVGLYKSVEEATAKDDGSDMPSVLTSAVLNRFRPSKSAQRVAKKVEVSEDEDEDIPPKKGGKGDHADTPKSKTKTPARKAKEKEAESMSEDDVEDAPKRKRGRPSKEKDKEKEKQEETPGQQRKRGRPAKKQKVEVESPAASAEGKASTPKSSAKKDKDGADSKKKKKPVSDKAVKNEDEDKEPEPYIGRRVRVWWPDDKKFYKGVVASYNPKKKQHRIDYDDDDTENLQMSEERWHYLEDASPKEQSKSKQKKSISARDNEPQGSSQKKSASKSKKRARESDDDQHQSESEARPKVNGSKVNGTVEGESSEQRVTDMDEQEPLETYRRRLKKLGSQQQSATAAAV